MSYSFTIAVSGKNRLTVILEFLFFFFILPVSENSAKGSETIGGEVFAELQFPSFENLQPPPSRGFW